MTLEEHNQRLLEYLEVQANLHANQECDEDCLFCVQENNLEYAPLEVVVDNLLEAHKDHRRQLGYTFSGCEYCQTELWMSSHNKVWREYRGL